MTQMKRILICIAILVVAFMCASCGNFSYTMRDDTFTVISEEKYDDVDSLSLYILRYKDNRMSGTGEPASDFYVIMNKNAFEVGDKVKLVKAED